MPDGPEAEATFAAMDAMAAAIADHFDDLADPAETAELDGWVDQDHLDEVVQVARNRAAGEAATGLDVAGWSIEGALGSPPTGRERAAPLPRPVLQFDSAVHGPGWEPQGPVLEAVRHIWLARFNPGDDRWTTEDGRSGSDVAAPGVFGWNDPATVITEGRNYWLNTMATPRNRAGILEIEPGDLIVVQRSGPGSDAPAQWQDKRSGAGDVLYGLAAAWQIEEWDEYETAQRERRVGLLPLSAFTYPVSRSQLRRRGRLRSHRFSRMQQRLDGTGSMGFTLTPITDDRDINELLLACGLSPDVLTEPDITAVGARVSSTLTGDPDLFKLRWDNRYRHLARLRHEQLAVTRAREWASDLQWDFVQTVERVPNAGCDLLFIDPTVPATPLAPLPTGANPYCGAALACHVEVEVKGYSATELAAVHLQPSQEQRARDSAAGLSPPPGGSSLSLAREVLRLKPYP